MGRKKLDMKIPTLIERCVSSNQRALLLHIGPKARNQVVVMHHVLQKTRNSSKVYKPSILWCFKKDDGFSFILHKTQKMLKKKYSGNYSLSPDDCFHHFLASADITFCHYSDTMTVLGQTYGMLIIQDFEALTPNILARIIECVEGGGLISILLPNIQALHEIPSLKMDAHSKYVTSAHSIVEPLFNYRFVLSLLDCPNCMVLDDDLRIHFLPTEFDSHVTPSKAKKSFEFKLQNSGDSILDVICSLCCTKDQADAVLVIINQLQEKFKNSVVSLTSARGRGKSSALGLAISAALYLKYSNIYVTSPHIDNLQTLFSFIVKGMKVFDFKEGKDYNIIFNSVENKNLICGINVFQHHKQVVRYIHPTEYSKVEIADLVVIDEAAAIPLPVVKNWLNSNMVLMSSTINGYEGTGRSLSLKLLSQLRKQSLVNGTPESCSSSQRNFTLNEITLNEAVRYANGDGVEAWLNSLFCLDSEIPSFGENLPNPELCQLYYVNKRVLFSYHNVAENFLQQLVSLFVSSHYKNCPNDLLMMADAPSHHLFCLMPPVDKDVKVLPDILCVIQVALEGKISKDSIVEELSHGKRASGDLIPWIISQQFQDNDFPMLSGARIVRIATHPNYQRMGYGQHALKMLFSYYKKSSAESLQCMEAEKMQSTLLLKLHELVPEKLDYIGVSYGLTFELLKFWRKLDFIPLYLRQTASEITGEHSCIMIKGFERNSSWLAEYASDFIERFITLLTSAFRTLPASVTLEMLCNKKHNVQEINELLPVVNTNQILSTRSIKRLEAYCNHLVDYHLIMDLMPTLSRSYFLYHFKDFFLSHVQEAILLSISLQNKAVEEIAMELNMETNQVMGLFLKSVKKILHHLPASEQNCRESKKNSKIWNEKIPKSNPFSYEKTSSKRKQETLSSNIWKNKKHKSLN